MSGLAVVNATNINRYALTPLSDGRSALAASIEALSAATGTPPLVLVPADGATPAERVTPADVAASGASAGGAARHSAHGFPGRAELQEALAGCGGHTVRAVPSTGEAGRGAPTPAELFQAMAEAVSDLSDAEELLVVDGDRPLVQPDLIERVWRHHVDYAAQYTFADGYPDGAAPEVLASTVVKELGRLAGAREVQPGDHWIFRCVEKDINAFDVETVLSDVDLRMLRISLACNSRRNHLLCSRIVERQPAGAAELVDVVQREAHLLRTLPAYMGVQIIDGCPQACSYCPFSRFGGNILEQRNAMPVERFTELCRRAVEFAGELTVGISLWGEPALHPGIEELARGAAEIPGCTLLIETSGVGWDGAVLERLASSTPAGSLLWIVSLDADDPERYEELRGRGFREAHDTAELLLGTVPEQTYIQAVRMQENEEHLEEFYRRWSARTDNVIIQKYDSFSGRLPDRSVVDLSPVNRFPCWHNKRDLYVLLDGTVPRCREDFQVTERLGNAFQESIDTIWSRGDALHGSQIAGSYPGICASCDEYYTFNF